MIKQNNFNLVSSYQPTGDQPKAIDKLVDGLNEGKKFQVLMGATGTGKTFTIANVIQKVNKPTLVLVHNKTLAGQLYAEFKELFPHNRVEYFVSNFDFYKPEAYLPATDTYIEKNAVMNEEIEIMRASSINSVLERSDTIIVASVASIYGLSDPKEYQSLVFFLHRGEEIDRRDLLARLVDNQYSRNNLDLTPGTFRVNGDVIEIAPSSTSEFVIKILLDEFDTIEEIVAVDPLTGEVKHTFDEYPIFPSHEHASTQRRINEAVETIKEELKERLDYFHVNGKYLEEERLSQRTSRDMETLLEFGMCPGIENYSRHIDKRKPGQTPFTLFDYFPEDFLLVVDESHVTLPQIRGMYNGDRSRKEVLVEYGFRLPSALDNRPLNFEEFEGKIKQIICTSATPGDYELEKTGGEVIEQIIRPTGLLDPKIEVRNVSNPVYDIIGLAKKVIANKERVMIVTMTINDAENLTAYLKEQGLKVVYLHNETKT